MDTEGLRSKLHDPLRIRDRIHLTLPIDTPDLRWRKGQEVSFRCRSKGHHPSDVIDIHLCPDRPPVAIIAHNLLARYLHTATPLTASTTNKSGTPWLQRRRPETRFLQICVEPGELNWELIQPILHRNNEIAMKIEEADFYCEVDTDKALAMYEDAANDIVDLHFEYPLASYWRRIAFPVNEISSLLETKGDLGGAYQAISSYEAFDDRLGLPEQAEVELEKRKRRITRQLLQQAQKAATTGHGKNEAAIEPPLLTDSLKQRAVGY